MPKRTDISTVLLIGSGPIVIGQACEFDYSGTQAAKVLRAEGYRVVLVNSNPATIMTDPEFADATYIEPITPSVIEKILAKERPDACLPTLGGQTALNVTTKLARNGVFELYDCELIGAGLDAIERAEDRGLFRETMETAGLESPRSVYCRSMDEARAAVVEIGYPIMIRPSFILGGGGTGIAFNEEEFLAKAQYGFEYSPVSEVLIEESVMGWKEYELEVMRDSANNAVIVCSIENLDPMGVHTGDSITVAPIQTLSDREYQEMRTEAIKVLEVIGVTTGGSNVQFAVDPATGRRLVIEMNPRVSRSSALASKATGFPIAKIAALLAVGYTLPEIANDITGKTPASFEPALDYVVVKCPRFDFAKFPSTSQELGTSMQSVGEAMAIGRTFPEALQKALRSLEIGRKGLNADQGEAAYRLLSNEDLHQQIATATPSRIFHIGEALRRGMSVEEIHAFCFVDPWFLDQMAEIVEVRADLSAAQLLGAARDVSVRDVVREAKRYGFSDAQIAYLWSVTEDEVRNLRLELGIVTTFKTVDTCAAEFEAHTPYMYSAFEDEDEVISADRERVVVLGSGPNRIGQGIEFDYCCVHASFALEEAGFETVMVNCNPETVSTDYDTSDRLYFEPLTVEDVLAVVEAEKPISVIVQLGGQTPLNLATALAERGVSIAGTSPDSINMAEDRELFSNLCRELEIRQPANGIARSAGEAEDVVDRIGFPVMVRPSFVLGGRAMRVLYSYEELSDYLDENYGVIDDAGFDLSAAPLLIDRFLEAATEVDIDAVFDGTEILIGGIMEHVEEAGVHSGDSACITPPPTISDEAKAIMVKATEDLARALGVRGLINIQFAVKAKDVFLLEANPRGSRTVPFISKATGIPLAKVATRVMVGATLEELRNEGVLPASKEQLFSAVKEAVLPWDRFPDEDIILGPEMRSTGEVMGISEMTGVSYGKALLAAGIELPTSGLVFFSLADRDKEVGLVAAQALTTLGYKLIATSGTARYLDHCGVPNEVVAKLGQATEDTLALIRSGRVGLVVNTPRGSRARSDGRQIRLAASRAGIPCVTTVQGALYAARSLQAGPDALTVVKSLQEWQAT